MIYNIISRVYFIVGIIAMFIPIISGDHNYKLALIGGGLLLACVGIMLMGGPEEKRKKDENILDDGEF